MSVFSESEIKSIDKVDLEGKLLIMDPDNLVKNARDRKFQVNYAYYGTGCCPESPLSTRKVYVYDLGTGEKCVYRRSDFIGYIEEGQLSTEQKDTLEVMLVEAKKNK